jgi:hypothetical protein
MGRDYISSWPGAMPAIRAFENAVRSIDFFGAEIRSGR